MSEKRRDNRNRILHQGESQRRDGRYMFKFVDSEGNAKYLYRWRLDHSDATPLGKRRELSLREKEKKLEQDLFDGISPRGAKLTVLQLVERYISLKTGVRHNTEANYKFVINIIKKEPFGKWHIDSIRESDAKAWLIKLQKDGRGYSTIHSVRGVVRPAFEMAKRDLLIRLNPFEFPLVSVVINDSVTRQAISRADERRFLKFVKEDNHYSRYYDGMYILFHTGLRISEFVGLTIKDIDFKEMKIIVDHQLQRKRNMEYVIEDTKTYSGTRMIPMSPEVAECFRRIIANRPKVKVEPMVGRCTGFLFLDKNAMPMVALHWEKYFQYAVNKFNSIYRDQLPSITPHVCRHTFCSNCAKSGMNPKVLSTIMGHSDVGITLQTYTHISFEDAREEMNRVAVNE